MKTEILSADKPDALSKAVDTLQQGELVAFPTDTVYGLAALAHSNKSIEQLYSVKGRDASKAIPILIGSTADLTKVTLQANQSAKRLAQHFWPGPLTLIVSKHPSLPESLSQDQTVGIRIPNHPVALALLRMTGPLATTSANLSGKESPSTAQEVLAQLDGLIPLILDGGQTPGGVPSTVVGFMGEKPIILRAGPITQEQIQQALSPS